MDKRYIDKTVSPGDDFFKFATGNWIKIHPKPDDHAKWSASTVIDDEVMVQLRELLDSMKDDDDPMSKKIYDFHLIQSDYERRNRENFTPVIKYIEEIRGAETKEQITKYTVTEHLCSSLFTMIGLGPDLMNSSHYEVCMSQDLSLSNKEYYLSSDKTTRLVLEKYKKNLKKLLARTEYFSDSEIEDMVETYYRFEKELAEYAYSYEKLDRPEENYHKMTVNEASKLLNMNMKHYLHWFKYDNTREIIIEQPEYIQRAFEMIRDMSVDDYKKCIILEVSKCAMDSLAEDYGEISFEFTQYMSGAKKRADKWKREVYAVDGMFYEPLGMKYAEKYFSGNAKEKMLELIHNIIDSYAEIIGEQIWMSEATREYALKKLHGMTYKIAYPDKWKDYSDMPVDREKSYFETCRELSKYFYDKELEERYNKDVDKSEWPMMPHTVNACYIPTENEICFPCGILQSPFFSAEASDAENYGAIGAVIGHEITHGFDTSGRLFDCDGNMKDWWGEEDSEKFKELTKNTREHFDNIEVKPGLKANGELTLDENIADYGGLKIAYRALEKVMKERENESVSEMAEKKPEGLFDKIKNLFSKQKSAEPEEEYTWQQQFFISYAHVWAGVVTDEIIRHSTLNNVHSLNYMRVNGTLPMFDKWYEAFGITEKDKLYLQKDKRAKIW